MLLWVIGSRRTYLYLRCVAAFIIKLMVPSNYWLSSINLWWQLQEKDICRLIRKKRLVVCFSTCKKWSVNNGNSKTYAVNLWILRWKIHLLDSKKHSNSHNIYFAFTNLWAEKKERKSHGKSVGHFKCILQMSDMKHLIRESYQSIICGFLCLQRKEGNIIVEGYK